MDISKHKSRFKRWKKDRLIAKARAIMLEHDIELLENGHTERYRFLVNLCSAYLTAAGR